MKMKSYFLRALGFLTVLTTTTLAQTTTWSETTTLAKTAPLAETAPMAETAALAEKREAGSPPTILDSSNLSPASLSVVLEKNATYFEIKCIVQGHPKPKIIWKKDGESMNYGYSWFYSFRDDYQILRLEPLTIYALGTYNCTAWNTNGVVSGFLNLDSRARKDRTNYILIGTVLFVLVLVGSGTAYYVHKTKGPTYHEYMTRLIVEAFFDGNPKELNSEISPTPQIALLPYIKSCETDRSRINLDLQIGKGAFGPIYKAQVSSRQSPEKFLDVAVKIYDPQESAQFIRVLECEIKTLSYVGKHLNIVNLVGANTFNLMKDGEIYLLLEYCNYGNLLNFIRRRWHTFPQQQMDPNNGNIPSTDSVVGEDVPLCNTSQVPFSTKDHSSPLTTPESSSRCDSCTQGLENQSFDHCVVEVNAPEGNTDTIASHSGTSSSPPSAGASPLTTEDHQTGGDEGGEVGKGPALIPGVTVPFSTSDLVCWAWQVARGMDFLSERKVFHGGLALENIFLSRGNIVKVANFGFAHEYYFRAFYQRKTMNNSRLRWLSLEALRDVAFSTQGDVWSFGVLLWELFSLGKTPYQDIEFVDRKSVQDFIEMLEGGYRLEMPQYASSDMYSIMKECWDESPLKRPKFKALCNLFDGLLPPELTEAYKRKDRHYKEYNAKRSEDWKNPFSLMGTPEYKTQVDPITKEDKYKNRVVNIINPGIVAYNLRRKNPATGEFEDDYASTYL